MDVWNDSAEWLLVRAGPRHAVKRRARERAVARRAADARPLRLPADHAAPGLRAGPTARAWPSTSASTSSTSRSARAWAPALGPASPQPDVLNYTWREYGNRVGAWRCLELSTPRAAGRRHPQHRALRPLPRAGGGLRGARRRADRPRPHQRGAPGRAGRGRRARAAACAAASASRTRAAPRRRAGSRRGSRRAPCTPDLLAETGYRYTLNWCHDDQPVRHAHPRRRAALVGALPAGAERHPDDRRRA